MNADELTAPSWVGWVVEPKEVSLADDGQSSATRYGHSRERACDPLQNGPHKLFTASGKLHRDGPIVRLERRRATGASNPLPEDVAKHASWRLPNREG
jgi:hypothetical protein